MSSPVTPGLLILHGNQLEQLRAAVFQWLRNHPLGPLESDIFLVQSNGVAEWLKIALAEEMRVCAATRVALPARFLWETYRGMLGRDRVPVRSAFDKSPLTWRLMRLLPTLLADPVFTPLRHFLADGEAERRLQLAERLADLFDQYQVYRADWLADWAAGRDQLRGARGDAVPLPLDQRWQGQLWRAVIADVPEQYRELGRATVHTEFVDAIAAGAAPLGRLPRRIVLFGVSALPYQSLQALASLARHTQVLLAVPNPCQFYWGDIIEGRDLLRSAHRRQQLRKGQDLSQIPLEELHAHSHPLLASWGRQGRDFIRMLDEFDAESTAARAADGAAADTLRIDLFSGEDGGSLLEQVQAAIRDLLPLSEHAGIAPPDDDRSIEFHVTHSVQREVEVLHDQLLAMFAAGEGSDAPLRPRDVVVMVPDIDTFSAAIHAVFAQHKRNDPRYIPFEIADVKDRSVNPLLVALERLLRLPQQRCRQSEVRDLLDVPALAARFGLGEEDLPTLGLWIEGAGVRWGLDQSHRSGLGLAPAGEQNAWIFGVRRMLLGYASGDGHGVDLSYAGIEPYAEVGGLDAALAGSLAQLVEALLRWRALLAQAHTPAEWGALARALLAEFFKAGEEGDRLTLAQLEDALTGWLDTCDGAEFDEAVPLAVLREAWHGATRRPLAPRRRPLPDAGSAAGRARQAVYQLGRTQCARQFRAAAVGAGVAAARLSEDRLEYGRQRTESPHHGARLQPFSRRYFEAGGLLTYAREWRAAHVDDAADAAQTELPPYELDEKFRLKLIALTQFMRQPVRYFFRQRLGVTFGENALVGEDEEPFSLNALEQMDEVRANLETRAERLGREGLLPIGLIGQQWQRQLVDALVPVRSAWLNLCARYPLAAPKQVVNLTFGDVLMEDWIDQLRSDGSETVWLAQMSSKVTDKAKLPRGDKLIAMWLRQLAAAAMGMTVTGKLVARDVIVTMQPMAPADAHEALAALVRMWRDGMNRPLPTACKTALALAQEGDPRATYDGGFDISGENADLCLARLWPDFAALSAEEEWEDCSLELYGPLAAWLQDYITITPIDGDGDAA